MPATVTQAPRAQRAADRQLTTKGRRWWIAALGGLPNIVVFSALGAVLYFGHHTGWRLPKMSELTGGAEVQPDDWCPEHNVPESQCIECKPDLYPKGKPFGFCRVHGVAECVIHHPELAQVKGEPQLPQYDTAEAIRLVPRAENNSRNTLHTSRVQFPTAESVIKAGVEVDVVQERPMSDFIAANGELMFDPTRVAHLSTRVPGTVAAVFKTIGDQVRAGDVMALVDAAQVGQAKAQFLQASVQVQLRKTTAERLRGLATSGSVPGKSLIEAEASLKEADVTLVSARQALSNLGLEVPTELENQNHNEAAVQLRFLGIPSFLVATLSNGTATGNLIPIRAPLDGMVVASEVVAGETADSTQMLFTVADPRKLWLVLNVRQEDARHVRLESPVQFRMDDHSGEVSSKVSWMSPNVDQQTRTMKVRAVVENEDVTLRDKTFGTGRIILREEARAVAVPREAVQSTNDASFVFVRDKNFFDKDAPKVFHVRQVRIGARDDGYVELLAGVLPGEVIATKGSPVLLAQLLRSNLGAGCGCHKD